MCLRLADIPHTLLFILFWHPFVKTDESCLTLKAHLSVKTLCYVWFQQHTGSSFVYSKLDMPCFYIGLICSALLAVKI